MCLSQGAQAANFEIGRIDLDRQESGVYLSTDLNFELSNVLQDALLKGITLHFVTEVDISESRWYFYDKQVAHAARYVRMFYMPLTRKWRVHVSPEPFSNNGLGVSLGQSYDTAEEAANAVKHIAKWRIGNNGDINFDGKQKLNFSFKLDANQLPRPLQFGIVGQSDWNISLSKSIKLTAEQVQ